MDNTTPAPYFTDRQLAAAVDRARGAGTTHVFVRVAGLRLLGVELHGPDGLIETEEVSAATDDERDTAEAQLLAGYAAAGLEVLEVSPTDPA